MNDSTAEKLQRKKKLRLYDAELKLKTINKMRLGLLQQAHWLAEKGKYDDEFYVEANEILNEVERNIWLSIEEVNEEKE